MLIDFLVPKLRFLPRNKERKRQLHTIHLSVLILCCLFAPEEGGSPSLLAGRSRALAQGLISLYGWGKATYIGRRADLCETVAAESRSLCIVLRHRTLSSPIYLSEVTEQALHLIANISLIQRREKCYSREEKSAFP